MTIWIAEDDDNDAAKAYAVLGGVARKLGIEAAVFRDPDILWETDLTEMPPKKGQHTVRKLDHPPAVVILDLFDRDGEFRAAKYYSRLRREEVDLERPAAFVIVWSPKTGLDQVEEFVTKTPVRDRRIAIVDKTPSGSLLFERLVRCIRSWNEAVYP
jgi:hypothetical protein